MKISIFVMSGNRHTYSESVFDCPCQRMWQFSNPEDNEDAIRSCTGISGGPVLRADTPYLSECGVSSSFSGIRSPQPSDGTAKEAPHFCT
jgi:hypothetical protein